VALPEVLRNRYTMHLKKLTDEAPQLLICYEYDQPLMEGPPFSIRNEEVHRHYRESYEVALLESAIVPGGLKGKCAAKENVWLLRPIGRVKRCQEPFS
jgi:thiopurine S-methyltransferase